MREVLVPWAHASEWGEVYGWLYGPTLPERLRGVRRFQAWLARGRCPASVEATATFVSIQAQDLLGALPEYQLRLLYAMAFVRFINGLVDAAQRGLYAASVATIATKELGLPAWFVELRHAGTHDALPGLAILRMGCVHALAWLRDRYWEPQWRQVQDVRAQMLRALQRYKRARKADLRSGEQHHPEEEGEAGALQHFSECVREAGLLLPLLFGEGLLVPTTKQKRATLPRRPSAAAATAGTEPPGGIPVCPVLPFELQALWSPFLEACHRRWPSTFYPDALEYVLAGRMREPDTPEQEKEAEAGTGAGSPAPASKSHQATCLAWAAHFLDRMVEEDATCPTGAAGEPLARCVAMLCAAWDTAPSGGSSFAAGGSLPMVRALVRRVHARMTRVPASERTPTQAHLLPFCQLALLKDAMTLRNLPAVQEAVASVQAAVRARASRADAPELQTSAMDTHPTPGKRWQRARSKAWREAPIGCLPDRTFPALELEGFENVAWLHARGVLCVPRLPAPPDAEGRGSLAMEHMSAAAPHGMGEQGSETGSDENDEVDVRSSAMDEVPDFAQVVKRLRLF